MVAESQIVQSRTQRLRFTTPFRHLDGLWPILSLLHGHSRVERMLIGPPLLEPDTVNTCSTEAFLFYRHHNLVFSHSLRVSVACLRKEPDSVNSLSGGKHMHPETPLLLPMIVRNRAMRMPQNRMHYTSLFPQRPSRVDSPKKNVCFHSRTNVPCTHAGFEILRTIFWSRFI